MVIQLIHSFAESRFNLLKKSSLVFLCQILFFHTSSAVNPFGLTNRQFRKEYINLQQVLCPSFITLLRHRATGLNIFLMF